MTYGPPVPVDPPRNRHRWVRMDDGAHDRCGECFVVRRRPQHAQPSRWRDRVGNWHTGSIPRCGEAIGGLR